ncbi:C4-dicarboxylate transporter DcuC [Lachnoclostridium phytofermentans]|uniref:Anaerobic c4-dicarboxylate antiporter, DcuC family n=1 Tax=Lachnoclostridium phytofermentans (strain ATCC 700394 / DSM 18823 / ISDg) TaxID=357809 RepID=A9KSX8_LACP7|nr:C4-dicarboxylate transporter DcuC [Lachnoclostridium phytofermentans]ABX42189.1 anaerobic c4-dicarboxylate antiporter, DcuC family [Lachnoclostridium phytofermentans ISDg]
MNNVIMYSIALMSVIVVIVMLIKKMDIKITMFAMGVVLMYIATFMGNTIGGEGFKSSGLTILDPLLVIINEFKSSLNSAGFIIMILGGYTSYMSAIGANDVTVHTLTKPIKKIKSVYILVPVVFLIGNLLSLVIPSASNLAIILLATLYPVLREAGMTPLTTAAVLATTATVMPTPLGGDNVAIATELAKYPEFAGLTVSNYVLKYHALVSIPTLAFMAAVHFFWQKYLDKRNANQMENKVEIEAVKDIKGGMLFRTVYTILPVFPILLLIAIYLFDTFTGVTVNVSVELAAVVSFIIAIFCEAIRRKSTAEALNKTESFFKGMGSSLPIVALLVAATVYVSGLKSIGLISSLQSTMLEIQGSGLGFILPLILVGLTILIVLLSGSGTALFYALVPLMMPLATAAGINALAVTIPMALAGNIIRAVSPVAAVVMIVAGTVKISPLDLVKRTSLPMISGVIFMFILSMILFL